MPRRASLPGSFRPMPARAKPREAFGLTGTGSNRKGTYIMADLSRLADDLSNLTVLEGAELPKMLEGKRGVSAAAAVWVASGPGPGAAPGPPAGGKSAVQGCGAARPA